MSDQAVILFLYSVLAGFGTVWGAQVLRRKYAEPYLEQFFYFTLASVGYGYINWVLPQLTLFNLGAEDIASADWAVALFVLGNVPLLLVKLFVMFGLFQALLARPVLAPMKYMFLIIAAIVLTITVVAIRSYLEGTDQFHLHQTVTVLGVLAVTVEFAILLHCLLVCRQKRTNPAFHPARLLSVSYLVGYGVYVAAAYSIYLIPNPLPAALTPYLYFIAHALPLAAVWYLHNDQSTTGTLSDASQLRQLANSSGLTPREKEILQEIVGGASNQDIADRLHISSHTVRNHIYNIYRKTGIRNRFQLLAYCQSEKHHLVD